MLKENGILDSVLRFWRRLIPSSIFRVLAPMYHWTLAMLGAVAYGFPSRQLKVIAVTGTKGKSTTTYMIARVLEDQGISVAAIGSLGYKIRDREWPNTLKMTMPGRMKLQKFLREAVNAGCTHVVLETTSEGIAQHRLAGIVIDCAVFTNIHPEHIESHGSFENYKAAKLTLFKKTKNIHVLNGDDPYFKEFRAVSAKQTYVFGTEKGVINQRERQIKLKLAGDFNIYNALATLDVAHAYGLDERKAQMTLEAIESISGRMEFIQREPFAVVVDYAHTPQSLELVYETLKNQKLNLKNQNGKLICVLGSAGGGRDTWKRPKFGEIAAKYCDEIILTNEDSWDEDPEKIIIEIASGIANESFKKIIDRREAIQAAIRDAKQGDTVIITGKGSETSMALAGGRKIPWSDTEVVRDILKT
jgi:UDP-N-acetylmuramoyl-L-alanyl-D-glutamate--2,6-diaminopimelate ligase